MMRSRIWPPLLMAALFLVAVYSLGHAGVTP